MSRPLCNVVLCILLSVPAFAGKKPSLPAMIVNARYVYVTGYNGSEFSPRSFPDDRRAITDVQDSLKKWKKYIVVYKPEDADLILLVRAGRIAGIRPHVTIGGRIPEQERPGLGTDADIGPGEDMLAVYDARGGGVDSAPLWRQLASGGLNPPGLPLLARFRKDVEASAQKKP
jgi:hypothetical protein